VPYFDQHCWSQLLMSNWILFNSHFQPILTNAVQIERFFLVSGLGIKQCCAHKWFGTCTLSKCKSHNEINLHFVQVYKIYFYSCKWVQMKNMKCVSVKLCKFVLCHIKQCKCKSLTHTHNTGKKLQNIHITPKISIRFRYVCKDKKLSSWPRQLPTTIYPFVGKSHVHVSLLFPIVPLHMNK
jgi:hypothetical protein